MRVPFIMGKQHRVHPVIPAHAREMRHPQTSAETALRRTLRNRQFRYKFRRQHPIYKFIIDFYCAEAKLLIEVDGPSHFEQGQQEYDTLRTEYLEELGYKVIRFTNDDVKLNMDGVIGEILQTVDNRIIDLKSKR